MIFKIRFGYKTHRFEIDSDVYNTNDESFLQQFEIQLTMNLLKITSKSACFPLDYIDEDNDKITIQSSVDLPYHIEKVWLDKNMEKVYIYL